jgi:hypothetical protein
VTFVLARHEWITAAGTAQDFHLIPLRRVGLKAYSVTKSRAKLHISSRAAKHNGIFFRKKMKNVI